MLRIEVDNRKIKDLQKILGNSPKKIRKELNKAVNETLKSVERAVAKGVTTQIAVSQKVVKQSMKKKRSNPSNLSATVTLYQTNRIPLRDFGARQKKSGVSYKISKGGPRKTVNGAFQGPRPGVMKSAWRGRVFKRVGKKRLPIVQLMGPSPWGVYVNKVNDSEIRAQAEKRLSKEIDERIRFLKLKQAGTI